MKLNERSLAMWATSSSPRDKEGYLIKRGEMNKQFQRRWFVLKGNLLFYFNGQHDRDPVGVIILEEHSVAMSDSRETKYAFDITFSAPSSRVYTLAADSEAAAMSWIRAIAHASFEYLRVMVQELQRKVDELMETRRDTGSSQGDRLSVSSRTSRDSRRGLAASVHGRRPVRAEVPGSGSSASSGAAANFLSPHRVNQTLALPTADMHQRAATTTVRSTALAVGHTTCTSLLDASSELEESHSTQSASNAGKSPPPVPVPYAQRHSPKVAQKDPGATNSTQVNADDTEQKPPASLQAEHPLLMRGMSSDTNPVLQPTSSGNSGLDHGAAGDPNTGPLAAVAAAAPATGEVPDDDPLLAGAIAAAIASTAVDDDDDDEVPAAARDELASRHLPTQNEAATAEGEAPVELTEEELLKKLSFCSMHSNSFLGGSPSCTPRQRNVLSDGDSASEDLF